MAEYIDREALIKAAEREHFVIPRNMHPYDAVIIQGKAFRKVVDEAPAADVATVRHGRWDKYIDHDEDWGDLVYMECSVCKKHFAHCGHVNYCPNCGAKMDLEVKADAEE